MWDLELCRQSRSVPDCHATKPAVLLIHLCFNPQVQKILLDPPKFTLKVWAYSKSQVEDFKHLEGALSWNPCSFMLKGVSWYCLGHTFIHHRTWIQSGGDVSPSTQHQNLNWIHVHWFLNVIGVPLCLFLCKLRLLTEKQLEIELQSGIFIHVKTVAPETDIIGAKMVWPVQNIYCTVSLYYTGLPAFDDPAYSSVNEN